MDARNPWELPAALQREPALDPALVVAHFLDLVSARLTAQERDLLIARGCAVFQYRLRDAMLAVEARVCERLLRVD